MIVKIPFVPWDLCIHRQINNFPCFSRLSKSTVEKDRYNKIFIIGFGKTGTTSLEVLLSQFGFIMGNQAVGEVLSRDWLIYKKSDRIVRYCYTADAFQDAPFGYPGLYKELDVAFPMSKFILTVRDSSRQWFQSLVRFHTNLFSSDKARFPTETDLKNAIYRYKGYIFESYKYLFDYPKVPLYDETAYRNFYEVNNEKKRAYFLGRPNDFIEINLANSADFQRLCDFLHVETEIKGFPWLNQSK